MSRRSRKQQLQELEAQVAALRAELYTGEGQMADRITTVESIIDGHDATLDTIAELQSTIAEQRAVIAEQRAVIVEQQTSSAGLTARLGEVEARTAAQAAQAARVEARLGEISEQVLRQVEELSAEVDAASRLAQEATEGTGVPDGLLDELKAAQTRLAGEQVRYDLALRAELAEIADRLRRTSRG